jgi:hypothetical protein
MRKEGDLFVALKNFAKFLQLPHVPRLEDEIRMRVQSLVSILLVQFLREIRFNV